MKLKELVKEKVFDLITNYEINPLNINFTSVVEGKKEGYAIFINFYTKTIDLKHTKNISFKCIKRIEKEKNIYIFENSLSGAFFIGFFKKNDGAILSFLLKKDLDTKTCTYTLRV